MLRLVLFRNGALQHSLTNNTRRTSGLLSLSDRINTMATPSAHRDLSTTATDSGKSGRYNQSNLGFFGKAFFKPFPARGFQYKGQGIKRTWKEKQSTYTQKTGKRFSATNDYKEVQQDIFDSRGRLARILFNRLIKNQQIGEKIPIIRLYPDTVNVFYFSMVALLIYGVLLYLKDEFGVDYDFRQDHKKDANWREYISFVQSETRESLTSNLYTRLPLRYVSRAWGKFNSLETPDLIRVPMMKAFIWFFGVNMQEAYVSNVEKYKTINSLFRRRLAPGAREISETDFVAPCDGKVLSFGKLDDENSYIEQVKGIDYSLKALLGPNKRSDKIGLEKMVSLKKMDETDYRESWMQDPVKNDLYYAVIYLAPKDYHRFHSPVDWVATERRHFPGDLFSVNPSIASWLKNLFVLNERVVLNGQWKHGFMSYTAVGATLVGSIKIYFDEEVLTSKQYPTSQAHKHKGDYFDRTYPEPVQLDKGEQIGEFNMGSTVITVFEAPKEGFVWNFEGEGDKVVLGTGLNKLEMDKLKKVDKVEIRVENVEKDQVENDDE